MLQTWPRSAEAFKKRAVFVVLVSVAGIGGLLLLWEARFILLLLFAGYIGALILTTLTSWFQSLFRVRRGLALMMVISTTIVMLGFAIWLRGPGLAERFGDLQVDIATAAQQLSQRLQEQTWARWIIAQFGALSPTSGAISMAVSGIGGAMEVTAATVVGLFLAAITSLYLAAEPDFYLRGIRRVLPTSHRVTIEACFAAITSMLRSWLLAKALSMVIIGVLVTLGLLLLGVPLAGTLGTIAGLLTFIPNLGPILSLVPAALLTFAISLSKAS